VSRPWTQQVVDRSDAGNHRIKITAPGGSAIDVTYFRGIPTQLGSYAFGDPFGPSVAAIDFPQVSVFDAVGGPGLEWLVEGANVDILWEEPDGNLTTLWEGFIVSLAYSQDENTSKVSVQCKGALFQADNFEAYPEFPPTPIPYELLIYEALNPLLRPSLRTAPLVIEFPDDWSTVVPAFGDDQYYLRPYGVTPGDRWTGLSTRNTGSWNKALTGQIQGLLSLMFTADGSQWTVMLDHGRTPQLRVRPVLSEPDENTLEVWVGQPGVVLNLSEDWTQAANVYYGTGTDTSGVTYSNTRISSDGTRTSYAPFAASRQVHPSSILVNQSFDASVMRRETQIQFDGGLSPSAATGVALNQLQRSAHPGYTGSITLKLDPACNDVTFSRFLIQPGMSLLLHGFKGMQSGLLVHIAEVTVNIAEGSLTLTVDSKFRDLLTIQQVQARSRDALSTLRALKPGSFSPVIQDLRRPWSYAAGSGVIPSAPGGKDPDATALFTQHASGSDTFPWTDLTTAYPPKSYPQFYIAIPPASPDYSQNWAQTVDHFGIPCLFAQGGTIRLTQIAAYDQDGKVMPIRFHVSVYTASGINPSSMPMVPGAGLPGYLDSLAGHVGQHYPFFPGAFETVDPNGAPKGPGDLTMKQDSMITGWGNYYQGAGYYPNLQTEGGQPTGMLVDETTWTFDTTSDPNFQLRPNENFAQNADSGLLFFMIYAESIVPGQSVYFLGRCFRAEPGTS
jgi:hypothetical protein